MFLFAIVKTQAWNGNDKESLMDYANYVAQHEQVNVGMFLGIIRSESNFNPKVKNPVGSASGVLQFLDSTFKNYCINKYKMTDSMAQKNNPFIQINCAIEMLKEPYGYKHWWPSVAGWGHLLN